MRLQTGFELKLKNLNNWEYNMAGSGIREIENITNIYFIGSVESGTVKIGKSSNPEKRVAELQTGNSNRLVLYGVIHDVNEYCENRLHKQFEDIRLEGEWFKLTDELIQFIVSKTDKPSHNTKTRTESDVKPDPLDVEINKIVKSKKPRCMNVRENYRKWATRAYLISKDKSLRHQLESKGIYVSGSGGMWFYPDAQADLKGIQHAHYFGPDTVLDTESKKIWNTKWISVHEKDSNIWKNIKFSIGYSHIILFEDGDLKVNTITTSIPEGNVPVIIYNRWLYDASVLE